MKYNFFYILCLCSFFACTFDSADAESEPEEDEVEELTEFGELLQDKFQEKELPYTCSRNFDNYEPEEYLSEEDFRKLELFMIFPDGYETKRYSAEDRVILESGVTVVVVTSKDNDQEISTYAVTYDPDEWYVSNIRIGYEHTLIDLCISSEINGNKITRKVKEMHDDTEFVVEENYFIQGDGDIIWEEEMIGDADL